MGVRLRLSLCTLLMVMQSAYVWAQPPICGPGAIMEPFCSQACIICDINGFTGQNAGPVPNWDVPPAFCAPIAHNLRWIGFIAGSTNLTLEIAVSNCTISPASAQGLQMGIYEAIDCNISASQPVTNCDPRVEPGETAVLTNIVPLVIGQYYWLCIDGRNNDVCDYSVSVTNGSTVVPPVTTGGGIMGPATGCPGTTFTYSTNAVPNAPNAYWYLDGNQLPGSGLNYDIAFPGPGTYEVCVESSNTCSTGPQDCMTVVISDIPETIINGVVCPNSCFDFLGAQLCNPGSFSYNFTAANGCDSTVTVVLTSLPSVSIQLDTAVCPGQSVNIGGNAYTPGSYTVTLPGVGTCDTTLTLNVNQLPEPITQLSEVICTGDSYTLGTQVLTTSGSYTEVFASAAGCDSTVNLTLTVQQPQITNLTETVCFGGSASAGGQTFNTTGVFTVVTSTTAGCDSTINLDLTVLPELTGSETAEICQGDAYPFGGSTFTTSGSFPVVFTSADGCDSTVTLNLTVFPLQTTAIAEEICNGQTFPFGGNNIGTSGSYSAVFPDVNGCDSTVNLTLTVLTEITTQLDETICDGETFPFDGTNLGTGGSYSATYTSVGGCDSTVTLNLTVAPNPITNLNETICDGETFTIGSDTYSTTGSYSTTILSSAGCDSTINLNLTVEPAVTVPLTVEICDGDTYTSNGTNYTAAGNYSIPLTSVNGCDSTVDLTLIVNPVITENIVAQICDGDFYNLGGQGFNTTGQYSVTLTSAAGCDSILNLDLTVVQRLEETVFATICPGDNYSFNGSTYSTAGVFPFNTTSAAGCDSTVYLDLSVANPTATNLVESICQGESFFIGSVPYSTTGTFTQNLVGSNGCDSTVSLQLTVNQPSSVQLTERICAGEFYFIDNTSLDQPGTYNFTLTTVQGCDSLVELTLQIAPSYVEDFSATICPGTSYNFGGTNYTSAGSYSVIFPTVDGCDSLVTLNLFEEQLIEVNLEATICSGEFYDFNGSQLFNAGSYNRTFTTAAGCDSLILLELTVVDSISSQLVEEICEGDSFFFDGLPRTTSGIYRAEYVSSGGCDSNITLDLNVIPAFDTTLNATLCNGEVYQIGPQTFSQSGTYQVSLVNAAGCDSTINLNLAISGGDTTRLVESICDGGTVDVGSNTYNTTGTYVVDLTTPDGCDSTVVLDLTVASQVLLSQQETLCAGESTTIRGTTYSTSGTYTINIPGSGAECDTILTLDVAIGPALDSTLTADICEGSTYDFNGNILSNSGTFIDTISSTIGCDSVVMLTLSVLPTFDTLIRADICEGSSYTIGAETFSSTGLYQVAFQNGQGCDSIINLDLTVNTADSTFLIESICSGSSVIVGGTAYDQTGNYTVDLTNENGCDSIVVLDLTVSNQVELNQNELLCDGESVTVRGNVYTAEGDYTISIPGVGQDCDTLLTLTVEVQTSRDSLLTAQICAGETYMLGSQQITTTGSYTETYTASTGCDSTVMLTLTVLPVSITSDTVSICQGESYQFNGASFSESGTYTSTFLASNGCDSTVELTLQVTTIDTTSINPQICTGNIYSIGGQQLTSAGTYFATLTSRLGCDSIVQVELAVADSIVVNIGAQICAGDTYNFDGSDLSAMGVYRAVGQSIAGCDSITYLTLAVLDTIVVDLSLEICQGESVVFAGSSITDAGTYVDNSLSQGGCDSLTRLTLTVAQPSSLQLEEQICRGDSYTLAGVDYQDSGNYTAILQNSVGCDSTIFLDLTVVDSITVDLAAAICTGQTYNFGGQILSSPGNYSRSDVSAAGCDSITSLTLTVSDTLRAFLTLDLCNGESTMFNGQLLTTSGTYQSSGQSVDGCDSLTTLTLLIADALVGSLDTTLCDDEVLRIGGMEFSSAGNYTTTLTGSTGCDSTLLISLAFEACGGSPSAIVTAADATCEGYTDGALSFIIEDATFPVTVTWTNLTTNASNTQTWSDPGQTTYDILNLGAGQYTYELVDNQGSLIEGTALIDEPVQLTGELELSFYGNYQVSCEDSRNGTATANVSGGTSPYDYRWSTGEDVQTIINLGPGEISIAVTDENGCPWNDAALLTAPPPLELDIALDPISCEDGDDTGAFEIVNLEGGIAPYEVRLNDDVLTDYQLVTDLAPGTYDLVALDTFGCVDSVSFTLTEAETPKIDLGQDRTIDAGDSVRLLGLSTAPLDSLWWTSTTGDFPSCTDCLRPLVGPLVTTTYTLFGLTEEGCLGVDEIQIRVERKDVVFVPTAFSPNGDRVNDGFTLFTQDEQARIVSLSVFDRWGELLWTQSEFAPNVPGLGWDGTFKGRVMNPQVVVYYGQVRLRTGEIIEVTGDVSLIR